MLFQNKPFEVFLIIPRENTDKVLRTIDKTLTLKDFEFPKLRKAYPQRIEIVEVLSKLESFAEELKAKGKTKEYIQNPLKEGKELIQLLESGLERINNKEREIKFRIKRLRTMIELLNESEFIGIISIVTKSIEEWHKFQSELQRQGIRIVGTKKYEHEQIAIAKGMEGEYTGDEKKIRQEIKKDMDELENKLNRLEEEKKKMSQVHGKKINKLKEELESSLQLLEEKKKIAHTELFAFIKGVTEQKNIPKLEEVPGLVLTRPEQKEGIGKKYLKVIKNVIPG